ncbi:MULTISPECIES: hypothetical protein [Thioclava]|uniref:PEP-CTERM protein-sorting domain-containing protein n=1 Tax=Thioclava litoralis TaxID=3076557 RepID=A0ABZ1E1M1_9RHOB|nr:hypothetical protein RPE78_06640 [Thioclava sp. FTW29]
MKRFVGYILIAITFPLCLATLLLGPRIAGQGCAFGSATGCSKGEEALLLAMFIGLPLGLGGAGLALGIWLLRSSKKHPPPITKTPSRP